MVNGENAKYKLFFVFNNCCDITCMIMNACVICPESFISLSINPFCSNVLCQYSAANNSVALQQRS